MENLQNKSTDELKRLLEKKKNEKEQYNARQEALKIILNSAYGSVGNPHFRWYNWHCATAITLSGQVAIKWIADWLNRYMNRILKTEGKDYVIAIDTDSVYLDVSSLVNVYWHHLGEDQIVDNLDKSCEQVFQKVLDKGYKELGEKTNAFQYKLKMERENIGRGVFVNKKRYVMKVYDSEGVRYETPEMKIMGLEAIRSNVPEWSRSRMKTILRDMFVMSESDLQDKIKGYWHEFLEADHSVIATTTSVNGLNKYETRDGFAKGTPKHVKGAIMYNKLLKKHELTDDYEPISDGQKIKVLPLRSPNPVQTNAIAFPDALPPEFGLDGYVDKHDQFYQIFEEPLQRVFDVLGWSTEKKVNVLDELFG